MHQLRHPLPMHPRVCVWVGEGETETQGTTCMGKQTACQMMTSGKLNHMWSRVSGRGRPSPPHHAKRTPLSVSVYILPDGRGKWISGCVCSRRAVGRRHTFYAELVRLRDPLKRGLKGLVDCIGLKHGSSRFSSPDSSSAGFKWFQVDVPVSLSLPFGSMSVILSCSRHPVLPDASRQDRWSLSLYSLMVRSFGASVFPLACLSLSSVPSFTR